MKPDISARTSASPKVVDGVTFHCYRAGILRYEWWSEDGRLCVGRNYNCDTYCAAVDGTAIDGVNPLKAKRYRTESAAMIAAVSRGERR